jgi:UDP-3-O-[3-hydroxymyristoyl] glucosamine N-acyltransferase
MSKEFSVADIAKHIGGTIEGDPDTKIVGISALEAAKFGEIAFVEDSKFFDSAMVSAASCLIVPEKAELKFKKTLIRAPNPKLAFAQAAALLHPPIFRTNIHRSAVIAETAKLSAGVLAGAFTVVGENSFIGESTQIYDGVKIGSNVNIGKCCILHPNVVIYDNVTIGNDIVLHAGVIVGADGFGYVRAEDKYVKFPQIGTVVIEDEVEIGANSCIDRGALGETRIGRGTKIDNLVQIAHNVQIGERVIIAAQTGISGSTIIESDAVIGGQVGMGDHARVQSGAIIGSKAGVLPGKIVRAGVWWGVPVQPLDEYKRQNAHVKALPRLREEVKKLRERLVKLENDENLRR